MSVQGPRPADGRVFAHRKIAPRLKAISWEDYGAIKRRIQRYPRIDVVSQAARQNSKVKAVVRKKLDLRPRSSTKWDFLPDVDAVAWAQCDACQKWRVLPENCVVEEGAAWNCSLIGRSCDERADDDGASDSEPVAKKPKGLREERMEALNDKAPDPW